MSALEAIIPVVAIIATFGIPGIIIFWAIYTKHRERMRLIEKGLPPEEVKAYFAGETKPQNPLAALKWGILLAFIGAGIFVGNMLEEFYEVGDGIIFGVIVFCAGIGFLLYFAIASAKSKSQKLQQV